MTYNRRILKKAVGFVAGSLALTIATAANAGVIPYGVQTNVSAGTVSGTWGWSECFSTGGNTFVPTATALSSCTGDQLMMAVRDSATGDYNILAAASFNTVTAQTPWLSNAASTNIENGVAWYSNGFSWGFTEPGSLIAQQSADVNLANHNHLGLSWHTSSNAATWQQDTNQPMAAIASGWAFNDGTFQTVNGFERVLLTMNGTPVPAPAALGFLGFGLAGLGLARRRKA